MRNAERSPFLCAMPVFLTGFMCSGKTRVGRELAAQLGWPHADTDRLVEARVGPLVPYFRDHGEAAFREREREVLQELLNSDDTVVSVGGGTPQAFDNLAVMRAAGPVVFLDVPMDTLMPRIQRAGLDRPLLLGQTGEALRARVAHLLAERMPVYAQADVTVRADAEPAAVARRIVSALGLQVR
jgi:shikimate kinase